MKNIFSVLLFIISINPVSKAQSQMPEIKNFGSNPGNLKMYFHAPNSTWGSSLKKPMVIVLHGCSQTAEIVARQSGWNKLADENGFYVLYPQQLFYNNTAECFNWFNRNDVLKDKGEVLSISEMISYTVNSYLIDTTQIFIYGLSAGAVMSVSMLSDYPDLFKAGAVLGGGAFMCAINPLEAMSMMNQPHFKSPEELGELVRNQNPDYTGNIPRLIIIHGEKDFVVNYKNSGELIKQWTNVMGIDSTPSIKIDSFNHVSDLTKYSWLDKNRNEIIIFYSFKSLGHAVPVDPGYGKNQGGEIGLFATDKNFFSTYYIAKNFGLLRE